MRKLLLSLLLAPSLALGATIVSPLPNNIQNGQPADATKVMGNFNQIVSNVNSNAAALNAPNVFTASQQFSAATTVNHGITAGQVQNGVANWIGTWGGSANALSTTPTIAPSAYAAGQHWEGIAAFTNTGAVTANIGGLGSRAVTKNGASPLVAGDIVAGQAISLKDDGTRLQLATPTIPQGIPYAAAGGTSAAITATYAIPSGNLTVVDGMDLTVGVSAPNTSTPVTFTPTLNGVTAATWNVVKFSGGVEVPVAVNDLQGRAWLKADLANTVWVLQNPAAATGVTNTPLAPNTSTVTISIGSPAVISWTSHGRVVNEEVVFSTTGALPTGLTAGTTYYVISAGLVPNSFEVSATPGGVAVNTSGTQSGTQTGTSAGYALTPSNLQQRISVNGTMTLHGTAASLGAGFFAYVENRGAGTVTLTSPASNVYEMGGSAAAVASVTVPDTGAGAGAVPSNNGTAILFSDGTNFYVSPISAHGSALYSTPGTFSWVAPYGVTSVCVEGQGGGGGGGGGDALTVGGGGGGGGGGEWSGRLLVAVVPGTSYTVTVGAAGTGGAGDTVGSGGANGSAGGGTSFGALMSLSGGAAGHGGNSPTGGSGGGVGGAGGGSSYTFQRIAATSGVTGSPIGGAASGGAGGVSYVPSRGANGSTGAGPGGAGGLAGNGGGGGGGGAISSAGGAGGAGAPGYLILTW